jgi:exodeoxyribonuclease VII large subunit
MDDKNGVGIAAPSPPDCASTSGAQCPFFTLRDLVDAAGNAIRTGLPAQAWVEAQVLEARMTRSGLALVLVEAGATNTANCARLRCMAFNNVLARIEADLAIPLDPALLEGTCCVLKVRPTFHLKYQLELHLLGINPALAQGLLVQSVRRIRTALQAEGLFDAQRRLPTPPDLTRIAVVHPDGAAGWGDVAGELERWDAKGILSFVPIRATFEGGKAASSLTDALDLARRLAEAGEIDLVLVVRGGGDPSGLASVSNEFVARALLAIPVPVVVGLGHARDRTLLDEVAWRSCDTPSKAVALVRTLFTRPALATIRNWGSIRSAVDRVLTYQTLPDLERSTA